AGAASRLHRELVAADLPAGLIVLVLEGQARSGVAEGRTGSVRVVHAIGEGDDAIVAEAQNWAGHRVAVVSADRGLLARVDAVGAGTRRPRWLLGRL
ncbi:MAG TPA: hypothetical protein VFP34_04365, partial [Microlunatus sp.]|nr:hypothetical protein [Microlunatus sp.]